MQIALFNFTDFFGPLQSLASRCMPGRQTRQSISSGLRYVGILPSSSPRQGGTGATASTCAQRSVHAPRPLRVVRRVDAQQPGRHPSRMVISGRMADVCAELDRLAALEAGE